MCGLGFWEASFILVFLYIVFSLLMGRGGDSLYKSIICQNPNCDYTGPSKKIARGSLLVMFFLLLLGILPGILYMIFRSGYRYSCPRCGMQLHTD